jgi:hypothetical protein
MTGPTHRVSPRLVLVYKMIVYALWEFCEFLVDYIEFTLRSSR